MNYRDWNTALIERFLPLASPGTPACLNVTDEDLEEMAGAGAADDLAAAVRARYLSHRGSIRTERVRLDLRERRATTEPPGYVGLLAVCVLAASRMEPDPASGISASNYYARLRPLLGLPSEGGAPPGFASLEELWKDLDHWIRTWGRGDSTVGTHPIFHHIGYPISQSVFPARDLNRLPDFFISVGLAPGEAVTGRELLSHLRRWARPGTGLRDITVEHIGDDHWADRIQAVVLSAFRAWDGTLRDERGRRRAEVILGARLYRGGRECRLTLWPRRPEGFPDEVATGRFTLRALDEEWYEPLPEELASGALADGLPGLVALGEGLAFSFDQRTVYPLHEDLRIGGWASVRRIRLHERLRLIVRADRVAAVQRFLASTGEEGTVRQAQGLPPGWRLIIHDGMSVTPPLAGADDPELERLMPRLPTAMSFDGGLAVADGVYLRGEAPDLHVGLEESAVIRLDDEEVRLSAGGLKLALGGLPEGPHEVASGDAVRRFTVIPGYNDVSPPSAGTLAFVVEKHRQEGLTLRGRDVTEVRGDPAPGESWVAGASVRQGGRAGAIEPAVPLLLPRSGEIILIGERPGQIWRLSAPPRPAWLERISTFLGGQLFEAACPFPPAFAVRRCIGVLVAEEIAPAPAGSGSCDQPGPAAEWADVLMDASDAVVRPASARSRWEALVDAALAWPESNAA
ncbi:hypothetical protein [Silanimonas lenta]|uniref:hypothetical protein n=1 Tax=Silanimonas lenta TaxID=265429 RepID=UPI002FE372AB